MNTDRPRRMRDAILSLSRAEQRELAISARMSCAELTDWAELGGDVLPKLAMQALESWFEIHEVRSLFGRPLVAPFVASLADASGIAPADLDAFRAGASDLTPTLRQRIHDHFTGRNRPAGPATLAGSAFMPLPAHIALRGEAVAIINAMSPEALAAFVQTHAPTSKAAARHALG